MENSKIKTFTWNFKTKKTENFNLSGKFSIQIFFFVYKLFIFSPFIISFIAEYVTGFKLISDDLLNPWFAKYLMAFQDKFGGSSAVGVFLGSPFFIYALVCYFVSVPEEFGFLHIITFLHIVVGGWIVMVITPGGRD